MTDPGLQARRVWDVWRRLLANDSWRSALASGDTNALYEGIDAEDRAVVEAYAQTPQATRITITMYRRRCCSVARSSLSLVAPFSKRLLDLTGEARREALTLGYTQYSNYIDDGPNFCRTALRFIEFLRGAPEFCERPGWHDVLALDEASLRLQVRLARDDGWQQQRASDEAFDPDKGESYAELDGWVVRRCPHFEVAQTEHDVTPWLQAPRTELGTSALRREAGHFAVSLPNDEDGIEYAQLTADAAAALEVLRTPCSARELGSKLSHLDEDGVLCVLGDLFEEQLIRFTRP